MILEVGITGCAFVRQARILANNDSSEFHFGKFSSLVRPIPVRVALIPNQFLVEFECSLFDIWSYNTYVQMASNMYGALTA